MPVRTKTIGSRVTIGADPEFFLSKDEFLTSAIDRLGGSKTAPRQLGTRPGFFIQEDNVAGEFNIPPAKNAEEFSASLGYALDEISKEIAPMGCSITIQASALFPSGELTDPRAKHFGCDPDFNAWKQGVSNPKPSASNPRLRSCGGHVHVGYPVSEGINKLRLIQLMDLYLGVPSVLMDEDFDRRELYGKAGSFRHQVYGVEYRVLSNFWLKKPAYHEWVFEQTIRAVEKAAEFGLPKMGGDAFTSFMEREDLNDEIQECINGSNIDLAQKLCAHHELELVF